MALGLGLGLNVGAILPLVAAETPVSTTQSSPRPATTTSSSMPTARQERPRLFFTRERIARLQERISQEPSIRTAWEEIQQRADRYLNEKLVSLDYAESGRGQHGNYGAPSGQISGMATTLGLAFRLTGDERYAEKLKTALLHFGHLQRWAGDAGNDPPWHSELNTARFCFGYAVGYDCLHDTLTAAERQEIAAAMVRLGIRPTLDDWLLPGSRIHALDSMGHNWWSVCVAMAGVASLALVDDVPEAAAWCERIVQAFPEWFYYLGNILQNKSRNFDRDGAFYESVNYANYALSEYLLFRLAYANVFPQSNPPAIPLLSRVGDFFVDTCYPRSDGLLSVNFGDSSLHADGARTLRLLLANGFESPAYHWYLGRLDSGLKDPLTLVYNHDNSKPLEKTPEHVPTTKLYGDIGWAMLRSSWNNDATLLAVKSGFAWNHAHPDAGSFILFHGGEPLIIDSGNCSYSRREYSSYYRQSQAHNVVLLDGKGENPEACGGPDRGVAIPGEVHHLLNAAGVKYVLADATGPTSWICSRNYRHFLWLDGVILIIDDLRGHEAGQFEWLLHYAGTAEQQAGEVLLTNGPHSRARVLPLFPEHLAISEKQGLKDHDPDTKIPYLAFAPTNKVRDLKFITAIVPLPANEKLPVPEITRFQGEDMLGVTIRSQDRVTDVLS